MGATVDWILYKTRLKKRPMVSRRSREAVLNAVPVRNALVEWEKEETGEISLKIPSDQKRHLRILIRLLDLPNKRVIALDAVGSFVWERCDGEHTFGEIAQELATKFGMTRREAEASLAEFFRVLGKRGILGFAVTEEAVKPIEGAATPPPNKRRKRAKTRRKEKR